MVSRGWSDGVGVAAGERIISPKRGGSRLGSRTSPTSPAWARAGVDGGSTSPADDDSAALEPPSLLNRARSTPELQRSAVPMPPTAAAALLPADVLQETETTLSVLASMFPEPELVLPPFALEQPLASLADLPDELRGVLTLTLDDADAAPEVLIDVVLGLRVGKHGQRLLVRQPAYLSNAQFRGVLDDVSPIQGGEAFIDDVLLLSDYLREAIPTVLREAEEAAAELEAERKRANANTEAEGDEIGMDRVWFWL